MAKIKETMTVSLEEFGKKAGKYALDEFEYKGLTIRQWADKITSGEYQPVKHGRWLDNPNHSQLYSYICSNCRNSCDWIYRYCPNCGSKNKDGDKDG